MSEEISKNMQSFFIAMMVVSIFLVTLIMFYYGWYQEKPNLDVVAGYILSPMFLLVGSVVGYYFGTKQGEATILVLKQLLAEKKE